MIDTKSGAKTAVPPVPEGLLREIWEHATDGLLVNDDQGIYLYVNPAYCAMVGRTAEELVGKSFLTLVPPSYQEMYRGFYAATIATRGNGELGEFQVQHKDGRLVTILTRHSLLPGEPRRHVFVNRDITEQRAFEQHQLHADRMRTLGTLAGGVAHEFNNLLVSILGYAELIQSSKSGSLEMLREFGAKIQRASRRGRELTAQLLPFARPEAREKHPVDLHQVVKESADLFRLSSPGLEVELDLQARPSVVLGDAIQLHQVFLNLFLGAAASLASPNDPVQLRTRLVQESLRRGEQLPVTPYEFVLIEVSPQPVRPGAGSTEEPFYAPDPFDDRTGLAMALVHGSLKSHGGWMAADEGRLRIWLPAHTG